MCHHQGWQPGDLGLTLIAPGRRMHLLWSLRQNTFILIYSARAAGMAPVLFDLSRQATRVFAACFLRSLSQPDTHMPFPWCLTELNQCPSLAAGGKHAEPALQAAPAVGYLILRLKELSEHEVCLTLHFFFLPISHFIFCLLSILLRFRWMTGGTRCVGSLFLSKGKDLHSTGIDEAEC